MVAVGSLWVMSLDYIIWKSFVRKCHKKGKLIWSELKFRERLYLLLRPTGYDGHPESYIQ
jgi:hypothetical protein